MSVINKKIVFSIFIIILIVIVILFVQKQKDQEQSLSEFPSFGKFSSNVPPFEKWQTVEIKDKKGRVIAEVKDPLYRPDLTPLEQGEIQIQGFVRGITDIAPSTNKISFEQHPVQEGLFKSIREYVTDRNNIYIYGRNSSESYNVVIGKYFASAVDDYSQQYYESKKIFLLTKYNVLVLDMGNPELCLAWSSSDDPNKWRRYNLELLKECHDYFSVYMPVAEKVLSTLKLYSYVDDRGFATSSEVKLLPDELRIYEVR